MPAAARGDVYVANGDTGTIGKYTASGMPVNPLMVSGLNIPVAMAVSGSDLYVTNYVADVGENTIGKFTTSGTTVDAALLSGFGIVTGIAASGSDLFITDGTMGTIGEYTTSGATVNNVLVSGLNRPMGLAVSGSNLYVTNYDTGTIGEYTTSGYTVNAALVSGLNGPTGIAVCGSDLYVANSGAGTIGKYSTSGDTLNAALISGLNQPHWIAVSDSDLYVTNSRAGTIGKYTTSGAMVSTTLVSGLHSPAAIAVGGNSPSPNLPPGLPIVNISPGTQVSSHPGPGQYWGFNEGHGDGMVGWSFSLLQPVTVTQVGWYDDGQDGLSRDFQVGLWAGFDKNSPQLIGIEIPAGPDTELIGSWRVIDLPEPLELQPGSYVLGGLDTATTPDTIVYALKTSDMDSTLAGSRLNIGPFFYGGMDNSGQTGLHQPEDYYLANGLEMGPMLFISAPEPSTFLLVGVGAVMMLTHRQQGRRKGAKHGLLRGLDLIRHSAFHFKPGRWRPSFCP